MEKIIKGRVWRFGEDINTDLIIPARYLNTYDPAELAKYCMVDADPDFPNKVRKGDIIVAGKNFGCGSSREHAPIALKAVGISCVVAKSFARIFFRNTINIGFPIVECPGLDEEIQEGDELEVDFQNGKIFHIKTYCRQGSDGQILQTSSRTVNLMSSIIMLPKWMFGDQLQIRSLMLKSTSLGH